jgi:hypothetical protein
MNAMNKIPMLPKSSSRWLLRGFVCFVPYLLHRLAAVLMTLITIHPVHAAMPQNEISQQQAELAHRIDRIREQLAIENKTAPRQDSEKIVQWYNWPNWPNWPNWGNWRNWPNY